MKLSKTILFALPLLTLNAYANDLDEQRVKTAVAGDVQRQNSLKLKGEVISEYVNSKKLAPCNYLDDKSWDCQVEIEVKNSDSSNTQKTIETLNFYTDLNGNLRVNFIPYHPHIKKPVK